MLANMCTKLTSLIYSLIGKGTESRARFTCSPLETGQNDHRYGGIDAKSTVAIFRLHCHQIKTPVHELPLKTIKSMHNSFARNIIERPPLVKLDTMLASSRPLF